MKIIYGDFVFSKTSEKELNIAELSFAEKTKADNKTTYHKCIIPKNELKAHKIFIDKAKSFNGEELDVDLFTIYCDGGSFNNNKREGIPSFGSYGTVIFKNDNEVKRISGCTDGFTNNMGELTAFINGLEWIAENCKNNKIYIRVISDSQYVIKGCNEWMAGWIKRGWKNNENQALPNIDMWQNVYNNFINNDNFIISFKWVKGHSNKVDKHSMMNEACDLMCNEEINKFIENNYPELKKRTLK